VRSQRQPGTGATWRPRARSDLNGGGWVFDKSALTLVLFTFLHPRKPARPAPATPGNLHELPGNLHDGSEENEASAIDLPAQIDFDRGVPKRPSARHRR